MSIDKQLNKGRIAAGAAMVALSGFVPQPMMQQANAAATATINVTGSLVTGISLVAVDDVKFGTLVPTATAGTIVVAPGLATTVIPTTAYTNAKHVGNAQDGSFKLQVLATGIDMDATVKGIGLVPTTAFVATAGGSGPTGTVKIDRFFIGPTNITKTAKITFNSGGGTTDTIASAFQASVTAQKTINVGAALSWTAPQPIGQFTVPVSLTLSF